MASIAPDRQAGTDWLAACSPAPHDVRNLWRRDKLALIASGDHWLAAQGPLVAAFDAASRIPEDYRGPVLAHPGAQLAWWLVPADAAEDLADVHGLTVQPAGWALRCPPADRLVDGRFWLHRPDGSGRLTAPAMLGAALGPGCPLRAEAEA